MCKFGHQTRLNVWESSCWSRQDVTTIRPYMYAHFEQFIYSNSFKEVSWLISETNFHWLKWTQNKWRHFLRSLMDMQKSIQFEYARSKIFYTFLCYHLWWKGLVIANVHLWWFNSVDFNIATWCISFCGKYISMKHFYFSHNEKQEKNFGPLSISSILLQEPSHEMTILPMWPQFSVAIVDNDFITFG